MLGFAFILQRLKSTVCFLEFIVRKGVEREGEGDRGKRETEKERKKERERERERENK